jgi:hypothetical protein
MGRNISTHQDLHHLKTRQKSWAVGASFACRGLVATHILILLTHLPLAQGQPLARALWNISSGLRAAVGACPLQHLQVPFACWIETGHLIPGAAVGTRPLEHLQMASSCCPITSNLVPRAAVGVPTGAPPGGLLLLRQNMTSGPRGSRWRAPTATPPGGLLWLHKHRSSHPRGNRWHVPIEVSPGGR